MDGKIECRDKVSNINEYNKTAYGYMFVEMCRLISIGLDCHSLPCRIPGYKQLNRR